MHKVLFMFMLLIACDVARSQVKDSVKAIIIGLPLQVKDSVKALILRTQPQKKTILEELIVGVQLSMMEAHIYNEIPLSNSIALRSGISFTANPIGLLRSLASLLILPFAILFNPDAFLFPVHLVVRGWLVAEPRWYYNFNRRMFKHKNVSYNSSDFLSLKVGYVRTIYSDNLNTSMNNLAFIPTWGMRRSRKHIEFELGIGLGYVFDFNFPKTSIEEGGLLRFATFNPGGFTCSLHFRLGYCFLPKSRRKN